MWVLTFVAGTANDYIFMLMPMVDNFWQAQAVLMLTPRMPLYIPCVYNAFMYWSCVAAWRVCRGASNTTVANVSRLGEACFAALLGAHAAADGEAVGAVRVGRFQHPAAAHLLLLVHRLQVGLLLRATPRE